MMLSERMAAGVGVEFSRARRAHVASLALRSGGASVEAETDEAQNESIGGDAALEATKACAS